MGRKNKKPNYSKKTLMQETTEKLVKKYGTPFDDRLPVDRDHVSIRDVASEFGITILKARKILITAGVYTTVTSREVQQLAEEGLTIPEIMKRTKLSRASVHSYLPYSRVIYNMPTTSVESDRMKHLRARKQLCGDFLDKLPTVSKEEAENALWKVMEALEGCIFYTAKGLRFRYKVKGGELFIDRKKDSITKSTVFMAFQSAMALEGNVSGPKKLGIFGASYLYPIFQRIGIIKTEK